MKPTNPNDLLRYHVTGAIERGEAEAIVEIPVPKKETMNKKTLRQMEREIRALLISLKREIGDEYRCSDDPEDNAPGMLVTVATNDGITWSYQTGDNSYSGGCYGCQHWSLIYLYRRSNCTELAASAVDELAGLVEEEKQYETV